MMVKQLQAHWIGLQFRFKHAFPIASALQWVKSKESLQLIPFRAVELQVRALVHGKA